MCGQLRVYITELPSLFIQVEAPDPAVRLRPSRSPVSSLWLFRSSQYTCRHTDAILATIQKISSLVRVGENVKLPTSTTDSVALGGSSTLAGNVWCSVCVTRQSELRPLGNVGYTDKSAGGLVSHEWLYQWCRAICGPSPLGFVEFRVHNFSSHWLFYFHRPIFIASRWKKNHAENITHEQAIFAAFQLLTVNYRWDCFFSGFIHYFFQLPRSLIFILFVFLFDFSLLVTFFRAHTACVFLFAVKPEAVLFVFSSSWSSLDRESSWPVCPRGLRPPGHNMPDEMRL